MTIQNQQDRKDIIEELKEYRNQGYTLQVKLTASLEVLRGEWVRVTDLVEADELEEEEETEFINEYDYKDNNIEIWQNIEGYVFLINAEEFDQLPRRDEDTALNAAKEIIDNWDDELTSDELEENEEADITPSVDRITNFEEWETEYLIAEMMRRYEKAIVKLNSFDQESTRLYCISFLRAFTPLDLLVEKPEISGSCELLDSPVYNGDYCLLSPNFRIFGLCSDYNYPKDSVEQNYWLTWNYKLQQSLQKMRQSKKDDVEKGSFYGGSMMVF